MADTRAIRRADPKSNLVDVANLIGDVLKGRGGDTIILRYDGASFSLDVDNPSGSHINIGGGVFVVTDAAIAVGVELNLHQGKALVFWNVGDTNTTSLVHSGTADTLEATESLKVTGSLGVGILPTVGFQVQKNAAGAYVSIIEQTNASGGAVHIIAAGSTSTDYALKITSNSVDTFGVTNDGKIIGAGLQSMQKPQETAACTATTALNLGATNVPGGFVTLTIGRWTIEGDFEWTEVGAGDVGNYAFGSLAFGTATGTISQIASIAAANLTALNLTVQATKVWAVNVTGTGTVVLQTWKGGGAGTSTVNITTTTITATYCGNPV